MGCQTSRSAHKVAQATLNDCVSVAQPGYAIYWKTANVNRIHDGGFMFTSHVDLQRALLAAFPAAPLLEYQADVDGPWTKIQIGQVRTIVLDAGLAVYFRLSSDQSELSRVPVPIDTVIR